MKIYSASIENGDRTIEIQDSPIEDVKAWLIINNPNSPDILKGLGIDQLEQGKIIELTQSIKITASEQEEEA